MVIIYYLSHLLLLLSPRRQRGYLTTVNPASLSFSSSSLRTYSSPPPTSPPESFPSRPVYCAGTREAATHTQTPACVPSAAGIRSSGRQVAYFPIDRSRQAAPSRLPALEDLDLPLSLSYSYGYQQLQPRRLFGSTLAPLTDHTTSSPSPRYLPSIPGPFTVVTVGLLDLLPQPR